MLVRRLTWLVWPGCSCCRRLTGACRMSSRRSVDRRRQGLDVTAFAPIDLDLLDLSGMGRNAVDLSSQEPGSHGARRKGELWKAGVAQSCLLWRCVGSLTQTVVWNAASGHCSTRGARAMHLEYKPRVLWVTSRKRLRFQRRDNPA